MNIKELIENLPVVKEDATWQKRTYWYLALEFFRRIAILEDRMGFPGLYPFGNYASRICEVPDLPASTLARLADLPHAENLEKILTLAYQWEFVAQNTENDLDFPPYEPLLRIYLRGGQFRRINPSIVAINDLETHVPKLDFAMNLPELDIRDSTLDQKDQNQLEELDQSRFDG